MNSPKEVAGDNQAKLVSLLEKGYSPDQIKAVRDGLVTPESGKGTEHYSAGGQESLLKRMITDEDIAVAQESMSAKESAPDSLDDEYLAGLDSLTVGAAPVKAPTLDDLTVGKAPPDISVSEGTANTLSALGGMFQPDAIPSIKNALATLGVSQELEDIMSRQSESALAARRANDIDVLADPMSSNEDKDNALKQLQAKPVPAEPAKLVMDKSHEVGMDGLTTTELGTYQAAKQMFGPALNYLHEKQALDNALRADVSGSSAEMAAVGTEMTVPLYGNYVLNEIVKASGMEIDSFLSLGDTKKAFRDTFMAMPLDKRIDLMEDLTQQMKDGKLGMAQDVSVYQQLSELTSAGAYSDDAVFWDNAWSYVDAAANATGLGAILVKGVGVLRKAKSASTTTTVNSMSPASVVAESNPKVSNEFLAATVLDETDETAQLLYGTNRDDAIAHEHLSQIAGEDGAFDNKSPKPPSEETAKVLERDGTVYITPDEEAGLAAAAHQAFSDLPNVHVRGELTSVRSKDKAVTTIKGVYGAGKLGSFSDPVRAIESVIIAGRKFGLTDNDVTLMRKEGGEWVETSIEEERMFSAMDAAAREKGLEPLFNAKQEYVVSVNYDVPNELLEPKNGYSHLSVFGSNKMFNAGIKYLGSVGQNIFTKSVQFAKEISAGATAADAKRTQLIHSVLEDTSKAIRGLGESDRTVLNDLLMKGDKEGRRMSVADVYAAGGSEHSADALRKWNQTMDDLYHVSNRDLITTLRAQGWKQFVNEGSDTLLLMKDVNRQNAAKVTKVYDAASGKIVTITKAERKRIYDEGGSFGETQSPIRVGETEISYVLVPNKVGSSYSRAIANSDEVLAYRPGYVPRKYDSTDLFIDRVTTDANGKRTTKAVRTASNSVDAQRSVEELRRNNPDMEFQYREAREAIGDPFTDLNMVGRSTNQRVRGEQLEQAVKGEQDSNILDPFESLTKSVQSVANRASMRNYLNHTKARFINNFGNVLPKNPVTGRPEFPSEASQISSGGYADWAKMEQEAISNYNNIRSMENGYINALGNGQRTLFNTLGRMASKLDKTGKMEEVLRGAGGVDAAAGVMKTASATFISLNFVAQSLMGSWHMGMLVTAFPQHGLKFMRATPLLVNYKVTGKIDKHMAAMAGMSVDEAKALMKDLDTSKLLEGVDGNYIIREGLMEASDANAAQNKSKLRKAGVMAKNVATAVPRAGAKAGSEMGAKMALSAGWFIARERKLAELAGKPMTARDMEEVMAKANEFVGNPNKLHDQPYSHTAIKPFFQFIQMSHKMALAPFSRNFTTGEKARLATAFMVMMPKPAYIYDAVGSVIDPEEHEELFNLVVDGLLGHTINQLASLAYEETDMDFSRLSPLDPGGFVSVLLSMLKDESVVSALAGTGGAAIAGKMGESMVGIANWINPYADNPDERSLPQLAYSEARNWAPFLNNYEKGRIAYESGIVYSNSGNIVGWDSTKAEAIGVGLGLAPKEVTQSYARGRSLVDTSTSVKDEAKAYFQQLKRQSADMDVRQGQDEYAQFMAGKLAAYKGNNGKAFLLEFNKLLEYDVKKTNDPVLATTILRQCRVNYADRDTVFNTIAQSRLSDKLKKDLTTICEAAYTDNSIKE